MINIKGFDITKKKSGDGPQTNTGRVQKMNKQKFINKYLKIIRSNLDKINGFQDWLYKVKL